MRNEARTGVIFAETRRILADFGLLTKFRLSSLVIFSAVMAYAIVSGPNFNWIAATLLTVGGFLVTGAANALNQVLERDYDLLMTRTANRPVATGRISVSTAVLIAGLMALFGISFLSVFNPLTGFLGTLSLISYAFVYTPLKRNTPLAVAVGALPGALPTLIGCVAYEGTISPMGLMLFMLQILWQFPHFWAVAWLADADYKKAGFNLLPSASGKTDASVGWISLYFCIAMFVNAGLGYYFGLTSVWATLALCGLNAYFAYTCVMLAQTCSREAARRQMFASFFHLPFSLIIILIDIF